MRPIEAFLGEETAGGALLFIAALIALVWANVPGDTYADVWDRMAGAEINGIDLRLTLGRWVNDLLMAVFFFVVGLEIKREILSGELSDRRAAALPVAAALGGMAVPALLFIAFNAGGDGASGWGIPMATDIAFAIGALSLLGKRVSPSLKAFLLALAIVDDIGAIAVIALFYTDGLSSAWLAAGAGVLAAAGAFSLLNVRSAPVYALIGLVAWLAIHESGVHATIVGVFMALILPVRYGEQASHVSAVDNAEHTLHPWSSYLIVPLFALANAGVDLGGGAIAGAAASPVSLGIVLALVVGKPIGITLCSLAAVRAGFAQLPRGVRWAQILGAGMIAGIGFTVSIFISELAFTDQALVDEAKIGILAASAFAGIAGYVTLRVVSRAEPVSPDGIASG